jgi:hypothetical protein
MGISHHCLSLLPYIAQSGAFCEQSPYRYIQAVFARTVVEHYHQRLRPVLLKVAAEGVDPVPVIRVQSQITATSQDGMRMSQPRCPPEEIKKLTVPRGFVPRKRASAVRVMPAR